MSGGRSYFFLVTLLTVVMVALPTLYTRSSVYGDQDASPPDTQITTGPSGTIDYPDVTFSWTGWDDITPASQLEYSFNLQGYDTGWSDWASATTKDYTDLRGGSYIFQVKARDQSGNVDPTPAGTAFCVSWSFAVLTDLHVGNGIGDYDGPGYDDSGTPISGEAAGYAQDAVNEINKIADSHSIAFVAVLGDLTDSAEASELGAAKLILDNLTVPWIPIMGNHDTWPMTDNQVAPLRNPPSESYFDSIMGPEYSSLAAEMSGWGQESPALVYDTEAERDTYFENFFFDYGGFHFVCLDFNSRLGYRAGELHDFAGGTWSWFRRHMEQFVQQTPERSRDVILLAHHPMTGDGADLGKMTFTNAELDGISNLTNDTYYSYVDSSDITQTRPYASRIWGQLAGHTHPWKLQVDYPAWSNGGPVISYPPNYGGVRIGIVKVTSETPDGVDYSGPTVATEAATISPISATLSGYLASPGTSSSVRVSFQWGLSTSYGQETTPQWLTHSSSFSDSNVTGLTADTTYHFRAKAVGNGTDYGADATFTTTTALPNRPPNLASNVLPTNGGTQVSLTPILQSSAFSDPDSGDTHAASQWQVTTTAGDYSSPILDSGTDAAHLTSITVPSLSNSTTYYWQVRHQDNHGDWSQWSAETSFTTATANQPPVTPSAPSGARTGTSGTSYTYWAKTTDPDGDSIAYTFDWGDGTTFTSTRKSSGTTIAATHSWVKAGTYAVKVKGTDSKGNVSAWSASLTVVIA